MMRWLQGEAEADIIFLQETGMHTSSREEAEQSCRKEGWKVAFNPSAVTDKNGPSGGVGLVCKRHIGMGHPPPGLGKVPGERVIARWISGLVPGGCLFASLYLVAVTGLGAESKLILGKSGSTSSGWTPRSSSGPTGIATRQPSSSGAGRRSWGP